MKKSSKTPIKDLWQAMVEAKSIEPDLAQSAACVHLDRIARFVTTPAAWWTFGLMTRPTAGLYLWGKVGRGKTFLIDLLVQSLPTTLCQRWHFHRFMGHIHEQMTRMPGTVDPLVVIAKQIKKDTKVLCLDELFVEDIADAMILGRLFQALIQNGVIIVTTSNCSPDMLYRNGLQREKFIPAIHALQAHCTVVNLDGHQDWRLRHLQHLPLYLCPADATAHQALAASFDELRTQPADQLPLNIYGRELSVQAKTNDILWVRFEAICCTPTSARDYIELARCFHTIVIEHIPFLTDADSPAVVRFIHLIDELYDRHVKLFISADAPIGKLYQGTAHPFAFARTQSRLHEMQTSAYLEKAHQP